LIDCQKCLNLGYIIKEWKKRDNNLTSVKMLLTWRPAVHIIYYAEVNSEDKNATDVRISIEAQFEFFMCERNQRINQHEPRCNICTIIQKNPKNGNQYIPVNQIRHYIHNIKLTDQKLEALFSITKRPDLMTVPEKYRKDEPLFRRDSNHLKHNDSSHSSKG